MKQDHRDTISGLHPCSVLDKMGMKDSHLPCFSPTGRRTLRQKNEVNREKVVLDTPLPVCSVNIAHLTSWHV